MGDEQSYDVIMLRELLPGRERGEVARNLAAAFGLEPAVVSNLFSRAPTVVKRNADAGTANQYAEALRLAGVQCEVREAGTGTGAGAGASVAAEAVLINMGVPAWAVEAVPISSPVPSAEPPDSSES